MALAQSSSPWAVDMSDRSHDMIYANIFSAPLPSYLGYEDYPPLTTFFTAGASCTSRWILTRPSKCQSIIVYSYGTSNGTYLPADPQFDDCQPYSTRMFYNPGAHRGMSLVQKVIFFVCSNSISTPLPVFAPLSISDDALKTSDFFEDGGKTNVTTITKAQRISIDPTPTSTSRFPKPTSQSQMSQDSAPDNTKGPSLGTKAGIAKQSAFVKEKDHLPELEVQDDSLAKEKWFLNGG
ncbi:hypothetical protein CC78DRAFT_583797 [Lojkania enalia]|uniref:Uncharacterized protein n=1 Tax=Lojkania enalia TaxID=147567 RepID=A0A9P4MXH5_9PLEO|nr:hypothetical protein CC78DRAFT_583797 [Didymosphaeria enalia]